MGVGGRGEKQGGERRGDGGHAGHALQMAEGGAGRKGGAAQGRGGARKGKAEQGAADAKRPAPFGAGRPDPSSQRRPGRRHRPYWEMAMVARRLRGSRTPSPVSTAVSSSERPAVVMEPMLTPSAEEREDSCLATAVARRSDRAWL